MRKFLVIFDIGHEGDTCSLLVTASNRAIARSKVVKYMQDKIHFGIKSFYEIDKELVD